MERQKKVIITGGGRGLGRQFAVDFQIKGHQPFVLDINEADLADLRGKTNIPGRVVDVNLTGVFLCTRETAAHMVTHDVKGVVINISSISRAGFCEAEA